MRRIKDCLLFAALAALFAGTVTMFTVGVVLLAVLSPLAFALDLLGRKPGLF